MPEINGAARSELFEFAGELNGFIDRRLENARQSAAWDAGTRYAAAQGVGSDASGGFTDASIQTGPWIQAGYRKSGLDDLGGSATGYDADSLSFALGFDFALSDRTIVGISGGYADINVDQSRNVLNEEDIKLWQVAGYLGHQSGPIFANAQLGYSSGEVDAVRANGLSGGVITGNYDVHGFTFNGTLGYEIPIRDRAYVSPLVSLNYGDFTQDGYTESGGLNLIVGEQDTSFLEGKIGLIAGQFDNIGSSQFNTAVRVAYVHDFKGDPSSFNVAFGNGRSALLRSADYSDGRFEYGIGVSWRGSSRLSLRLDLEGESSKQYHSLGGSVRAKLNF